MDSEEAESQALETPEVGEPRAGEPEAGEPEAGEHRGPRISIFGYYGDDQVVNILNHYAMVRMCKEIIEEDFQLNLADCVFLYGGGTWSSFICAELVQQMGEENADHLVMVLQSPFQADKPGKPFSGSNLASSHGMMYQRLCDTRPGTEYRNNPMRSIDQLRYLLQRGAREIAIRGLDDWERYFEENADYLIYLPLYYDEPADRRTYRFQGEVIFNNFTKPKRVFPWYDLDRLRQLGLA